MSDTDESPPKRPAPDCDRAAPEPADPTMVPGFFVPDQLVRQFASSGRSIDLIGAVRRHWVVFLSCAVAGVAGAAVLGWTITPKYRAEVLLVPVVDEGATGLSALTEQFRGLASLTGMGLPDSSSRKDEAIATLQSRAFTTSFIEENGLLPVLLGRDGDGLLVRLFGPVRQPLPAAVRIFDREVRYVREDKRTGLVRVTMQWTDPELAAHWANDLVISLNERMRSEAITEANRSIRYLEGELEKTSRVEVRQAIFRLIEGQMKLSMVASARPEYAFKVIDPATPPDRPSSPMRALLLVLGLLAGLSVGAVICVLRYSRSK